MKDQVISKPDLYPRPIPQFYYEWLRELLPETAVRAKLVFDVDGRVANTDYLSHEVCLCIREMASLAIADVSRIDLVSIDTRTAEPGRAQRVEGIGLHLDEGNHISTCDRLSTMFVYGKTWLPIQNIANLYNEGSLTVPNEELSVYFAPLNRWTGFDGTQPHRSMRNMTLAPTPRTWVTLTLNPSLTD